MRSPLSNLWTLLHGPTSSDCQNVGFIFSLFLSPFLLLHSLFLSFLSFLPFSPFPFSLSFLLFPSFLSHSFFSFLSFLSSLLSTCCEPPIYNISNPQHLDTWLAMCLRRTCIAMCHSTSDVSKNVKFLLSWNPTKFDWVARFRKTIPTVKSVSSSEIYKISGFQPILQ